MKNFLLCLTLLATTALADPCEAFLDAAEDGDLKALARIHVRVDCRDDEGETALMEAAEAGQLEAVRWLLDRGARLNLRDREGETALMEAAEEGHTAVVELLLDRGATLDLFDHHGRTALMWAVLENKPEVVALLLRRGAAVGLIDNQGASAVDLAAGNATLVNLLKARGSGE